MGFSVAMNHNLAPLGEGINHRGSNTVQPAAHLVGVLIELPAGMQTGHYHFEGTHLLSGVFGHGNSPAVVDNFYTAVGLDRYGDFPAVSGKRLVDGVIDDFIDHMMETLGAGRPDIHPRALAYRFKTLQHLDVLGIVVVHDCSLKHVLKARVILYHFIGYSSRTVLQALHVVIESERRVKHGYPTVRPVGFHPSIKEI